MRSGGSPQGRTSEPMAVIMCTFFIDGDLLVATESWRNDPRLQIMEQAKQAQAALDTEAEQAAGVTFNQSQVLVLISQAGDEGAMVSKLAPLLDRAIHTLTAAVTGLERKGLVQRMSKKGEDRRIVRIKLTAEGTDAVAKLGATSLPLP